MDIQKPVKYANESNLTSFEIEGIPVTLSYEIIKKRKYGIFGKPVDVLISVKINTNKDAIECKYQIPNSGKVGKELTEIEFALYGFIDKAVRYATQQYKLQLIKQDVDALNESFSSSELYKVLPKPQTDSLDKDISPFIQEVTNNTLTSLAHLSNITSLNSSSFKYFQDNNKKTLEDLVSSQSISNSLKLLKGTGTFLDHSAKSYPTVLFAQEETLNYLQDLQKRDSKYLSKSSTKVIIEEFVPHYLDILKKNEKKNKLPRDIVGHTFKSFIEGGIKGWLVLNLIGENVYNELLDPNISIPGWYIGAGIQFIWPYLNVLSNKISFKQDSNQQKQALVQTISQKIEMLTSHNPELQDYILEFKEQKQRALIGKQEVN